MSGGVWGSKECLGVPREVLGDKETRENVTPNTIPKSYKERHGLSKTIVLTPPFHPHTSTNHPREDRSCTNHIFTLKEKR